MATIREELVLTDKFTPVINIYIDSLGKAAAASRKAGNAAEDTGKKMEKAAKGGTDSLSSSLERLAGVYLGIKGMGAVLNLSDSLSQTNARLQMVNEQFGTQLDLQDRIFEAAERSRGSYMATAQLIGNLGTMASEAFSSPDELISFGEQINKLMRLSGASSQAADAAMLQLTQGLSSGTLRGEELNSVLEQTPKIARTVADYLGVSTGQMRELAAQGQLTADVVKNAVLGAAQTTNEEFSKLPATWGDVLTQFQNQALQTFQPILDGISRLAGFVSENLDSIIPVFYGVAAGIAAMVIAFKLAQLAASGFFITLLKNPLTWIAVIIGFVVMQIFKWADAVGGFGNLWTIIVAHILYFADTLKIGFFTVVYWILDVWDSFQLKILQGAVAVQNFFGDLKATVLWIVQEMVNGVIKMINWFVDKINVILGIFGTEINPIEMLTFGDEAIEDNEAAKSARNDILAGYEAQVEQNKLDRQNKLDQMYVDRDARYNERLAGLDTGEEETGEEGWDGIDGTQTGENIAQMNSNVASIEKSVSMSEEDIKSLVDMAERQYINNINLTSQTPVINISGANTGNTAADRRSLADAIKQILIEQSSSSAIRTTAKAF